MEVGIGSPGGLRLRLKFVDPGAFGEKFTREIVAVYV